MGINTTSAACILSLNSISITPVGSIVSAPFRMTLDTILWLKLFSRVPLSIGIFRTIVCFTVYWKRSIYLFSVFFCWESPVFYYTCLDRALPLHLCNLYTQSYSLGSPISLVGTGAFLEVVVLGILYVHNIYVTIWYYMYLHTFAWSWSWASSARFV